MWRKSNRIATADQAPNTDVGIPTIEDESSFENGKRANKRLTDKSEEGC